MKKKVVSALAAVALMFTLTMPAFAAWEPSKVQKEVGISSASIKKVDGQETPIEVTTEAKVVSDGTVENVTTAKTAFIKVTPVSQTQAANKKYDEENGNALTFDQKASNITDTGLTYGIDADTNMVYMAAVKSDSTSTFLGKMNGHLKTDVETKIQEKTETKKTELMDEKAALEAEVQKLKDEGKAEEAEAKQAEVDVVDAKLTDIESEDYNNVDNYTPMAVFDVTASEGAIEEMGENGKIAIELEIPGATEDGDYIGLHFMGELKNAENVQDEFENNFAEASANYDAEVLDVTPGDGKVTIELSSFSPVMILTRVETSAAVVDATPNPADTSASNDAVSSDAASSETVSDASVDAPAQSSNGWVLPIVIVVVVIIAGGIFVVTRSKKKETVSKK